MLYGHERPSRVATSVHICGTRTSEYTPYPIWADDLHLHFAPCTMLNPNLHIDVLQSLKVVPVQLLPRDCHLAFNGATNRLATVILRVHTECSIVQLNSLCLVPSLGFDQFPLLRGRHIFIPVYYAKAVLVAVFPTRGYLLPIWIFRIDDVSRLNAKVLNISP